MRKKLILILSVIFIVMFFICPVVLAETDQPPDPSDEEPAPEPVPEPTQEPAPEPAPPTQAPAESAGTVDFTIYTYYDGKPAEGYTVQIDQTKQVSDSQGKVLFPNLTVEAHDVKIINKSGHENAGLLYMSRASSTVATSQAMGGRYGIDVAHGANRLYMVVNFTKGKTIEILSVTDTQPLLPSLPSVSPDESAVDSDSIDKIEETADKKVTAGFSDEDGKKVNGLAVTVGIENGPDATFRTNNEGFITIPVFTYGTTQWSFKDMDTLTLTARKGVQTSLISRDGNSYDISVAPGAKSVYLEFEQDGSRYVLRKVSEDAPAGLSPLMLGIIVVIIIVTVIIIIAAVKRAGRRRDYERAEQHGAESQRRGTSGVNKFDNRHRM